MRCKNAAACPWFARGQAKQLLSIEKSFISVSFVAAVVSVINHLAAELLLIVEINFTRTAWPELTPSFLSIAQVWNVSQCQYSQKKDLPFNASEPWMSVFARQQQSTAPSSLQSNCQQNF